MADGAPPVTVCVCLTYLIHAVMRMLKWIGALDIAQDMFDHSHKGLPELFASWRSLWETPYNWQWDVDRMHTTMLRPAPGGWWPLDHRGIAPVVDALQGA